MIINIKAVFSVSILLICMLFSTSLWSMEDLPCCKPSVGLNKTRTIVNYNVPDVSLINQDGKKVDLHTFLNSDKIIVLDFIFTTCSTICPILSSAIANFQNKMGDKSGSIQMVSVSIDPGYDTPEILKEYSERYDAQKGWEFLTGSREDINATLRAFGAYVSNKMDHAPLTFLHAPGSRNWVRINGFLSPSEFLHEYHKLTKL